MPLPRVILLANVGSNDVKLSAPTIDSAGQQEVKMGAGVTIGCVVDPLKGVGHQDYQILATVNHPALGTGPDSNPGNDDCPRPPNLLTGDKGCGGKGGTTVFTDVTFK